MGRSQNAAAPADKRQAPNRHQLIRTIYACAKSARMGEDTRRDVYRRIAAKGSITDMTDTEVLAVAAEMKRLAPTVRKRTTSAKPHVRKVYALWWRLADAGCVAKRGDRHQALNRFVRASTFRAKWGEELTDAEFLSVERASDVIEALKDIANRHQVRLER